MAVVQSVQMRHPKLEGRTIEVAASAVPHHKRAGWFLVDDQAPAEEPKPTAKKAAQKGSEG